MASNQKDNFEIQSKILKLGSDAVTNLMLDLSSTKP